MCDLCRMEEISQRASSQELAESISEVERAIKDHNELKVQISLPFSIYVDFIYALYKYVHTVISLFFVVK